MTNNNRRRPMDHDVVILVVKFLGWTSIILAGSLAIALLGAVAANIMYERPLTDGILAPVAGMGGAALGYIGGILTNAFRSTTNPEQARAIGVAVADASQETPIQTQSSDDGEETAPDAPDLSK